MKNKSTNPLRLLLALAMTFALLLSCLSGCAKTEPQPEASPAASSASQSEAVSSAPAEEPEESASASAAAPDASASTSAEEASTTDAQQLDRHELDEKSAAVLDGDNHEFEQEIAYRYYHGGEASSELADTERNQWMSGIEWGSVWGFDDEGHGVIAVGLGAAMHQSQWFIEYTSDYGETWSSAGMYFFVGELSDGTLDDSHVMRSSTFSSSFLVWSSKASPLCCCTVISHAVIRVGFFELIL